MSSKYCIAKSDDIYKLSEEIAHGQVCEMLGYYDIDIEKIAESNPDGAAGLETVLDRITDFIRRGTVQVVRDDGGKMTVLHTLKSGQVVTYDEVSAKSKLVLDRYKPEQAYQRMYAMMGCLCGLGIEAIQKFSPADLSVTEALAAVFSNA